MSVTRPSSTSWASGAGAAVAPARSPAPAPTPAAGSHARGLAWGRVSSLTADLSFVAANGIAVYGLRFAGGGALLGGISLPHYLSFLLLYAALVAVFCQNQGLYEMWRSAGPLDESFSILKAVFFATFLLSATIYLFGDKSISRTAIALNGLLNAVALPAWRLGRRELIQKRVASGKDGRNILIVGAGEVGQALARHFEEKKYIGYVVRGFLERNGHGGPGVIGSIEDLPRLALTHFAEEIFITTPSERELVARVVLEAREHHLDVKVVPELFDGLGWRAPIRYVGDFPVLELLREPISTFWLLIKRAMDVSGAVFGLLMLSPLLGVAALMIRLDSPGPAFYASRRMGKKGRKFPCYKLRTMVTNADELKEELRGRNERQGPFFKIANDPRITRVGRWLRKYSIDELPQLWNVLVGDMSLVGPRPHPVDDYERYEVEHLRRLDVKPGLTCLWQVYARRDPSFETNMALDLEYIETWNLWLDAKILLKTLPTVLNGSGA